MPTLKLLDTETNTYKSIPAIKGDKGERGEKGDKGDTYTITSNDYDAIADVVLTKLPSAESEEF